MTTAIRFLNNLPLDDPNASHLKLKDDIQSYIDHKIYKALIEPIPQRKLRYNQWSGVEKDGGMQSDTWIQLIAFSGFASHRTRKTLIAKTNQTMNKIAFVNDVTFLSLYNVRNGYQKYGAAAYFDQTYKVTQIYVSHNDTTYSAEHANVSEWEHAKWVWKVSVCVAIFLVDLVAHCRFRETSGLMKAMQTTLDPNHPIRRLLLPFTFGSVYANRVLNEYLKENALFHRCFAFEYKELSRLITDAMTDYKFKLLRV